MRKAAVWLLVLTLLLSACSRPKSNPPGTVTEPPASGTPGATPVQPKPLPEGPDLPAVSGPYELSPEQLQQGLIRYLSQGEGTIAQRLTALYDRWNLRPQDDQPLLVETDLDDDGRTEVVTALNGAGGLTGTGSLFVIYQRDGAVLIDNSAEEGLPGVRLFTTADLTGDGRPEIVWSSTSVGAHTSFTTLLVSRWEPGRLQRLPGQMEISFGRPGIQGRDLLLTGGTIGSAGAGMAQRTYTDRYRFLDGAFRLVDRRYVESDFAYHRLLDGIVAESFGRKADAEAAYKDGLTAAGPVLREDMVPPEQMEPLGQAVRSFARFRLGGLLLEEGRGAEAQAVMDQASGPFAGLVRSLANAGDRSAGCKAAAQWARQHPAFLEALSSPYGYANPAWEPDSVCGPLPASGS